MEFLLKQTTCTQEFFGGGVVQLFLRAVLFPIPDIVNI